RMSTTTISLPRPFILTKAWLASALIIGLIMPALYGQCCRLGQGARISGAVNRSCRVRESRSASAYRTVTWAGGSEEKSMSRPGFALLLAIVAVTGLAQPRQLLAQTSVQTQSIDPFGQEVTLTAHPIVYLAGSGTWDKAFDILLE